MPFQRANAVGTIPVEFSNDEAAEERDLDGGEVLSPFSLMVIVFANCADGVSPTLISRPTKELIKDATEMIITATAQAQHLGGAAISALISHFCLG